MGGLAHGTRDDSIHSFLSFLCFALLVLTLDVIYINKPSGTNINFVLKDHLGMHDELFPIY